MVRDPMVRIAQARELFGAEFSLTEIQSDLQSLRKARSVLLAGQVSWVVTIVVAVVAVAAVAAVVAATLPMLVPTLVLYDTNTSGRARLFYR